MMATKKTPKAAKKARTTKSPAKDVGGRPTKYRPAYAEQVKRLALLGWTDAKMAEFFGVTEQTFNNWKHAHPDTFFESLKDGRENADSHVVNSLYQSALGGGTVTETITDSEGTTVKVKQVPPNVTAQIFWLKNRQPDKWRDKVVLEDETPPETMAETSAKFWEIMQASTARNRDVYLSRARLLAEDIDDAKLQSAGLTRDDMRRAANMSVEELKAEFGYAHNDRF